MAHFITSAFSEIEAEHLQNWLSEPELARLSQLKARSRREDWLAGRWAAKSLVQRVLKEQEDRDLNKLNIEIGSGERAQPVLSINGKPQPQLSLSISHSHGQAYAGLSQISSEGIIGVDVEYIRQLRPKLFAKVLTSLEQRMIHERYANRESEGLLRCWSLKEAVYKTLKPHLDLVKSAIEVKFLDNKSEAQIRVRSSGQELDLPAFSEERGGFLYAYAVAPPDLSKSKR